MGETARQARIRILRVLVLAALLGLAGLAAASLPRPAATARDAPIGWLWLAVLFAVAEGSVVRARIRRESVSVSLAEIPVVIGLFLATPSNLLIGRAVGSAAIFLLLRRQTPVKAALNTALVVGATAGALGVFALGVDLGPALTGRAWLVAVGAAIIGGILEAACLTWVMIWYGEPVSGRDLGREVSTSILVPGLVAIVGVVVVRALRAGGSPLPLVLTGAAALLGYRAYAGLAERYGQLERLHRLSGRLAGASATVEVIARVFEEAAELLRADYVELVLPGDDGRAGHAGVVAGPVRWWARGGQKPVGPEPYQGQHLGPVSARITPVTRAGRVALAARAADDALVARLQVGAASGFLLVADRTGEERGFAAGDLRLLETVANQSAVALHGARMVDRLHEEARHDELTGLPNRLAFRELLDGAAARAAAGGHAITMLLDVDGFKAVNDTLGHPAGDTLLQELARRMREAVAGDAAVARLGGDEFAVLALPGRGPACGAPEEVGLGLAERLLGCFDEPVTLAGNRVRLGGSIGVALGPGHGTTAADLLRHADIAMYAAKASGGGARMFSRDLVEVDGATVTLAGDLRDALAAGLIRLELLPMVDLATGAVRSLEVLVRWRHRDLGEVSPDVLAATAERSGQTGELSGYVLNRALGLAATWRRQGFPVPVAVDVPSRRLSDPALPDQVAAALVRNRVPAEQLCLEITEAGVIAEPEQVLGNLERLRATGVRLSVDDFGTGTSSLTYLPRLPVHQLKIHHAFVSRLRDSARDRAVVGAVLDLGRRLGLDVVADGVTDAPTRDVLLGLGCRFGQGDLLGQPLPPDGLAGYLSRGVVTGGTLPAPRPGDGATPGARRYSWRGEASGD